MRSLLLNVINIKLKIDSSKGPGDEWGVLKLNKEVEDL